MNTTISPIPAVATRRSAPVRPGLLGGIGGLVFVGGVLVQNAMKSKFPANDAGAAEVMRMKPSQILVETPFSSTSQSRTKKSVLGRLERAWSAIRT